MKQKWPLWEGRILMYRDWLLTPLCTLQAEKEKKIDLNKREQNVTNYDWYCKILSKKYDPFFAVWD